MTGDSVDTLNYEAVRRGLTMRARDRAIRISRTIADLGDCVDVSSAHVREALEYRPEKALPISDD